MHGIQMYRYKVQRFDLNTLLVLSHSTSGDNSYYLFSILSPNENEAY